MNLRLALIVVCLAGTLFGDDQARPQKVESTKTDKFALPEAGTLRVQNSTGDLTIEAWDQPGVEITATKSTKDLISAKDRDKELKDLGKVHVSGKLNGDELVVTTDYPRHKAFPWIWPLSDTNNFDLAYHISVPRNVRIIVSHGAGEVHILDITGNIQVTAQQGLISLFLQGDAPRSIEAKSEIGSVNSDYPAKEIGRPWIFGNSFAETTSSAAQNLKLRIGFGDIIIRKAFETPLDSTAPTPGTPGSPSGN